MEIPQASQPRLIREGLAVATAYAALEDGRLSLSELDRLAIARKTLAHRNTLGRLTAEQSDRLDRLLRMIALAEQVFGDRPKAAAWLRRPTRPLEGEAPLDLLDTDRGCRLVEDLLDRISHGIAA